MATGNDESLMTGLNHFAEFTTTSLEANKQQINQVSTALENVVRRLEAGVLNPPPGGPSFTPRSAKIEVRLQNFKGGDAAEYRRWEDSVGRALMANQWTFPLAAHAVLASIQGSAADMVRVLNGADYSNWFELQSSLRRIFMSPSYKSKAKYLYANRVQLENEELSCYHGLLLSLRNNAFDNTDRSESALIEKFVAGIKNEKTHAAVHTQIAAGNAPSNYNEALEMSLRFEAEYEIIDIENRRKKAGGGKLDTRPTKMHIPQKMEIGVVQGKYCSFHKSNTHNTVECKAKQMGNTQKNSGYSANKGQFKSQNFSKKFDQSKKSMSNDRCLKCGGRGHWKRSCPSNQGTGNKGKGNFGNTGFKKKSGIHAISPDDAELDAGDEPTSEDEETKNEDWGTNQ